MSDPMSTWQRLRSGNEQGVLRVVRPAVTDPVAAVFRCSDPSPAGESLFGQRPGSLIDVSTWGHALGPGVIGTLEYAVGHLGVPLVIVLGHQHCAAMDAAMRAWTEGTLPDGAARTAVEQAISSIVRRGTHADSVESLTATHVVETGLGLLERSPIIASRVNAGDCGIVCLTADVDGRIQTHATLGLLGETSESLLECV